VVLSEIPYLTPVLNLLVLITSIQVGAAHDSELSELCIAIVQYYFYISLINLFWC
jgi:hypothetical protein